MKRLPRSAALARRRGVATVEFAIIAGVLATISFGIIDLGLLFWTQTGLQGVAAQIARCTAIGAAPCSDTVKAAQYASTLAGQRIFSNITISSTVRSGATCNSATGTYTTVTLSSGYWSGLLPPPFSSITLDAQACYPSGL